MGEVAPRSEGRRQLALRPPRRAEIVLYRLIRAVIRAFAAVYWRVTIHGVEHVPADRPFVLAPVHRSNVDFALAALVTTRRMRYIAKDSLWKVRPLGRVWSALGAFPVHRGSPDREALRTSIAVVENGEPLVLFPEGTRRSGPVVEHVFDGAAYVAGRAGVPIVPVGIGGSERAMPKGTKFLRPVRIVVVVGPPIDPPASGPEGRPARRAVRDTTDRVRAEVQRLFDEAQRLAGVAGHRD